MDRFASDEAGALRAAPENEAEVGDGLPLVTSDGFLEADEKVGLSLKGRVVLEEVGLAEPAYGREAGVASPLELAAPYGFRVFGAEPLPS